MFKFCKHFFFIWILNISFYFVFSLSQCTDLLQSELSKSIGERIGCQRSETGRKRSHSLSYDHDKMSFKSHWSYTGVSR